MKNIDKPIFKNATPSVSEKSVVDQSMHSNLVPGTNNHQSKQTVTPPVVPTLNFASSGQPHPGDK